MPGPIVELAARVAQPSAAIARLYAARLLGSDGIAPIELAEALGWRWDEALAGELGGLMRRRRGRCHLADEAIAELEGETIVITQDSSIKNIYS